MVLLSLKQLLFAKSSPSVCASATCGVHVYQLAKSVCISCYGASQEHPLSSPIIQKKISFVLLFKLCKVQSQLFSQCISVPKGAWVDMGNIKIFIINESSGSSKRRQSVPSFCLPINLIVYPICSDVLTIRNPFMLQ